mmetsp:Transcript_98947/g.288568  ORF Transcript_98947/g.288568 Transcript_98947/m.288568 type:complete len:409 (+) Transcript_98947:217-1443(+)
MSSRVQASSRDATTPCVPWQLFRAPAGTGGTPLAPRQSQARELVQALSSSIDALAYVAAAPEEQAPEGDVPADGQDAAAARGPEALAVSAPEDVQHRLQAVLRRLDTAKEDSASAQEARDAVFHLLEVDVPARLLTCLDDLGFEARKDAMRLFRDMLRLGPLLGADGQVIEYVRTHPRISQLLFEGSGRPEVFTHCAQMLRSCTRYPQLVAYLYGQNAMNRLIDLARHQSFDISSEAFSSLRELLLAHKAVTAAYLQAHFTEFFGLYNGLLQADDYVTQRQALRLLSEVLLDRNFMQVMIEYVGNDLFLQIHMNLLRASSRAIQLEAFHIFKIFVANPNKPQRVQQILFRNKDRLVKLLVSAGKKRESDKNLMQDLKTVVGVLQALGSPVSSRVAPAAAPANPVVMVQ